MYDPDVEEFKGLKWATEVKCEGIKSSEEEMKVEPGEELGGWGKVPGPLQPQT